MNETRLRHLSQLGDSDARKELHKLRVRKGDYPDSRIHAESCQILYINFMAPRGLGVPYCGDLTEHPLGDGFGDGESDYGFGYSYGEGQGEPDGGGDGSSPYGFLDGGGVTNGHGFDDGDGFHCGRGVVRK